MSGTPPSGSQSAFADGVRLAIGTLSVFPVRSGVVDRRAGGIAMTVAPLVGVALGACGGAVLTLALWLGITPLPASVLAVGTLVLLTRGLHLDGLADLTDGLGSGKPAERALDIMKQSDIGPFGVVALVFSVLIQVTALSEAASAGMGPIVLVTACTAGRLALTWACLTGIPAARPDGLGAMVAGTVRRGVAVAVTALVLTGTTTLTFFHHIGVLGSWPSGSLPQILPHDLHESEYVITQGIGDISDFQGGGLTGTVLAPGLEPPPAFWGLSMFWAFPVAVLVGLLAAWVVRRRAVRRLGGVTGDVLGALVEIATAATLLACIVAA